MVGGFISSKISAISIYQNPKFRPYPKNSPLSGSKKTSEFICVVTSITPLGLKSIHQAFSHQAYHSILYFVPFSTSLAPSVHCKVHRSKVHHHTFSDRKFPPNLKESSTKAALFIQKSVDRLKIILPQFSETVVHTRGLSIANTKFPKINIDRIINR